MHSRLYDDSQKSGYASRSMLMTRLSVSGIILSFQKLSRTFRLAPHTSTHRWRSYWWVRVCRGFSSNGSFLRSIWRVLILTEGYFPEWVIIRRHGLLLSLRSTWITFLITGESESVIILSNNNNNPKSHEHSFLMVVIHNVLFFNQCKLNDWERNYWTIILLHIIKSHGYYNKTN